jgi:hypothetical protein
MILHFVRLMSRPYGKAEGRRQKAEGRRQKAEGRRQNAEWEEEDGRKAGRIWLWPRA